MLDVNVELDDFQKDMIIYVNNLGYDCEWYVGTFFVYGINDSIAEDIKEQMIILTNDEYIVFVSNTGDEYAFDI